jgi:hypothetical protein
LYVKGNSGRRRVVEVLARFGLCNTYKVLQEEQKKVEKVAREAWVHIA